MHPMWQADALPAHGERGRPVPELPTKAMLHPVWQGDQQSFDADAGRTRLQRMSSFF